MTHWPLRYALGLIITPVVAMGQTIRGRKRELFIDHSRTIPWEIETMEVYTSRAQMPDTYAALDTTCGLMVIRTRRYAQ